MSNAIEVNDNTFEQEVINSSELTVVDFWAPWCGPCRKLGPVLDEIGQEYAGKIKIVKVIKKHDLLLLCDFDSYYYTPLFLICQ